MWGVALSSAGPSSHEQRTWERTGGQRTKPCLSGKEAPKQKEVDDQKQAGEAAKGHAGQIRSEDMCCLVVSPAHMVHQALS